MISATINLNSTHKDELLLTALIEKVDSYLIDLNGERKILKLNSDSKGKAEFIVEQSSKYINLKVTPKEKEGSDYNMRLNVFRSAGNQNVLLFIIATIDNPYRISTKDLTNRNTNRYIIQHNELSNHN